MQGIRWPEPPSSLRGGIGILLPQGTVAWARDDERPIGAFFTLDEVQLLGYTDAMGLHQSAQSLSTRLFQMSVHVLSFSLSGYCDTVVTADDLSKGPAGDVSVQLHREGQIRITITDHMGRPASGFEVLYRMDTKTLKAVGNARGETPTRQKPTVGRPIPGQRWMQAPMKLTAPWECLIEGVPCGLPLLIVAQRGKDFIKRRMAIDASVATASVMFTVPVSATITGRVVFTNGCAAPDMSIRFLGRQAESRARSENEGAFKIRHVPSGPGVLRAGQGNSVQAELPVEVQPGDMLDVGTIVLPTLEPLSGRVLATDPVAYEELHLRGYRHGKLLLSMRPDSKGNFVGEASAGELLLRLFSSVSRVDPVELGRLRVLVPARNLEVRVEGGMVGALRGRVPGPFAKMKTLALHLLESVPIGANPIGSARGARQWRESRILLCKLDNRRFEGRGILPGTYDLLIRGGTGRTMWACWVPRVEVSAGKVSQLGEVRLGHATLVGKVLDSDGKPVPRVVVHGRRGIGSYSNSDQKNVVTDAAGTFRMTQLLPGPFEILARTADLESTPTVVMLRSDAEETLVLRLQPPGRVLGMVTRRRKPQPGYRVTLSELASFGRSDQKAITDAEGRFTFGALAPGAYTLKLGSGSSGVHYIRKRLVTVRSRQVESVQFDLESNPTRIELVAGGRRVETLIDGSVYCLDTDDPEYGAHRIGRTTGSGSFSVDPYRGPMLVRVRVGSLSTRHSLVAVLENAQGKRSVRVPIGAGKVEIDLGEEPWHGPLPRLRLLKVPQGSVETAISQKIWLPSRRKLPGKLWFYSVPVGARVRLEGLTRTGRRRQEEFVVTGAGPVRLRWR